MTEPVPVCFFDEMNLYYRSGSVRDYLSTDNNVNYDKDKIVSYLSKYPKTAGCPRAGLDCVTGKEISVSFQIFSDGKYTWGDFLIYHIKHYPILLPEDSVAHVLSETSE